MAEGVGFPFLHCLEIEGRTYQTLKVVPSLPQVATRSALPPGSFRRRGFQPDLLMPQGHSCAEGVPTVPLLPNQKMLSEINAGYGRKGESYHGDIFIFSKRLSDVVKENLSISTSAYLNGRCDEE